MRIFKWTPTFSPTHESAIVPIWVNLLALPAHLYNKDALFSIASIIGKPLQLDDFTAHQSRLSAARIYVEIDLEKPLIEEVLLCISGEIIRQKILFEKLPHFCSLCRHLGHKNSECYTKGNAPRPPPRKPKTQRPNTDDARGSTHSVDKGKGAAEFDQMLHFKHNDQGQS